MSVDNVLTQTIQSTLYHHSRQQLRQPHAQLTQIVPDHTLVTQHHQPVSALIHWNGSILHGNVARVVLKMQTVHPTWSATMASVSIKLSLVAFVKQITTVNPILSALSHPASVCVKVKYFGLAINGVVVLWLHQHHLSVHA